MARSAAGIAIAFYASMAAPSFAGDKVLIGSVPDWVKQEPFPVRLDAAAAKTGNLPRFDQQIMVDGDKLTIFLDVSSQISSPEMLNQKGTLSFPWQPAHGDLTYHRIDIIRDGTVIDALKGGAGISVIRRETGLEQLAVDGVLTAVKHIDGLQVGDRLRLSLSISMRDPVLAGNVSDALGLVPLPTSFEFGRARLVWRSDQPLQMKSMAPGIVLQPQPAGTGWTEITVPLPIAKFSEMPKNIPGRFKPNSVIQFSSFREWREVGKVMAPLYDIKGTIPSGSDLAAKIDAIGAGSNDPVVRAAEALQLVQNEVRYQLIAIGNGNYVPQKPSDTWAKRYGDCKAKTLLLLAALDRLGIEAEPVLANTKLGDMLANVIPSTAVFDHVFVRARIKGEDFWLDGTGLGSRLEDIRDVPRFGYVLPVFSGQQLLALPRRANARSEVDVSADYDLSGGPHLSAPVTLTVRYAGPSSVRSRVQSDNNYDEELNKFSANFAKNWLGSEIIGKPKADYDAKLAIWTVKFDAVASPDWTYADGHYSLALTPPLRVVLDAPRDRASWRSIPALIDQPWTAKSVYRYALPDGGKNTSVSGAQGRRLSFAAVDWSRQVSSSAGLLTDEIMSRESSEEIDPKDLSIQAKAIDDAMGEKVHINLAATYPQKWPDVQSRASGPAVKRMAAIYDERILAKPEDAERLADRAGFREGLLDWVGAEADLTKAIEIDPSANRYLTRSSLRTRRGNSEGALADAQKAYSLEEGNEAARNQLASQLADVGKIDEAIALLPENPDVTTDDGVSNLTFRAEVLEKGGRYVEAVELLDGVIEKRKRSADLLNSRCWLRALRNDLLDEALKDCNQAIELAPGPAFFDSRGLVHFRSGRLSDAQADYAAVLAESPDIPSSLFMYGIVATKLGKKEEATAAIAAARKLHPNIDKFYLRYGIKP